MPMAGHVVLVMFLAVSDAFCPLPYVSLKKFQQKFQHGRSHLRIFMSSPTVRPPEARGPSFFEALWGIATKGSPWEYMLDMREAGYDGVVPVNLGPIGKYNFLLSPDSVKAATVEEASSLPRRFSVPLFETLELDKGLVYEQGSRHKRHKKICIPSFEQARSMEAFVGATRTELDAMSQRFADCAANQEAVDLYVQMRRMTLNVVLDVTFGLGSATANRGSAATTFSRADLLSSTIGEYLERIVALANEIPPLWQISPRLSRNYIRVTDFLLPTLRELVAEVISSRRLKQDLSASSPQASSKADLLGVLVTQPDLSDNDIRSILFDVVIAGSDTTASTTTAALYVLHEERHMRWLQRAREEAITMNAADGVPLEDILSTLPVATAVAREILRLYPPVPFVGRTAIQDSSLCAGKYPVNMGETYCFSPWFLGRDPKAWGAASRPAEAFDPQRWLDDAVNGGAPTSFSWLPFGAGPRGCLGTRLGLTEVTLGIARLLRDWDFEFASRGPLPVKYDLTLNLDGVMSCTLYPRVATSV